MRQLKYLLKNKTREIVWRCRDICKLFLESYLKIETNIHVVICTTEQTSEMVSATTCTLKTCIVV